VQKPGAPKSASASRCDGCDLRFAPIVVGSRAETTLAWNTRQRVDTHCLAPTPRAAPTMIKMIQGALIEPERGWCT
jgi:hypothetical protein